MRIKITLFFIFFSIIFISCRRQDNYKIPTVYVNRYLYVNTMDYIPISGYKYVDDGYRGLVIYRIMLNEFSVFERCCPYDSELPTAIVDVEPSGVICIDSTCASRYNLVDGGVISGPSSLPLKMYRYSYDGEVLHIYN